MATQKSNSAGELSLARAWHACENFEKRGIPCPYRLAGLETDDEDTDDDDEPIPEETGKPLRPTTPLIPFPERRRKPIKETTDGQTGKATIPVQYPLPGFPLPTPGIPPDEGPVPREPGHLPGQPVLPGLAELGGAPDVGRMPDGMPTIPVDDPNRMANLLRAAHLDQGLALPPYNRSSSGLNIAEVYSQWIPRLLNQHFQNMPDTSTPKLQNTPPKNGIFTDQLQETGLLEDFVRASRFAETTLIERMILPTESFKNTAAERGIVGSTRIPNSTKDIDLRKAIAAALLAATGGLAGKFLTSMRSSGGGGIGFQFPSMPGDPSQGLLRAP